jgi:hypothetical protein
LGKIKVIRIAIWGLTRLSKISILYYFPQTPRMKEVKRRDFLKNTLAAGVGSTLAPALLAKQSEHEFPQPIDYPPPVSGKK